MLRRLFISATSLAVAGITSKASTINNTDEKFNLLPDEKEALINFKKELERNLGDYANSKKLAHAVISPFKILERKSNQNSSQLKFINHQNERVTLYMNKGLSSISFG